MLSSSLFLPSLQNYISFSNGIPIHPYILHYTALPADIHMPQVKAQSAESETQGLHFTFDFVSCYEEMLLKNCTWNLRWTQSFWCSFKLVLLHQKDWKNSKTEIPKFKHFRKEIFWFLLRFYLNRRKKLIRSNGQTSACHWLWNYKKYQDSDIFLQYFEISNRHDVLSAVVSRLKINIPIKCINITRVRSTQAILTSCPFSLLCH